MRILLVGNSSLQNDAVKKILTVQDGWQVYQVSPAKIEEQLFNSEDHQFTLSLIDLSSLSDDDGHFKFVKLMQNQDLAPKLGVLYKDDSDELIEKLSQEGVHCCLSVNWETSIFIGKIAEHAQ